MLRWIPATLVAALLAAAPLHGQAITRPWTEWRTIETPHFLVHYPADHAAWTEPMAARLESIHESVTAFVGYEPEERITVIVDDPRSVSNGSAWPGGVVIMWPTPPAPETLIERHRGWGEILSVHEIAHVAHLGRPSRNPGQRFLYGLLPIPIQSIMVKTPRWATEGYATLIEGRLTGSGRPHGVARPTILRRWALEGALPTYEELSALEGFMQGEMAYLVGSAYLEWLVERSGEESLPHLWRRLTARRVRDFDEAFAGVFGAPPAELYGRFTVEVTEKALAAGDRLEDAGLVEGELVQRLGGWTFDPAVSPDGSKIALVRAPEREIPGDIVIWSTEPDTLTTKEREAEARLLIEDPEDVPDVEWRPRPRRALARLGPVGGRSHGAPRWLPDGERLLVVRWEGAGDGTLSPDLFEWRWRSGDLRRVTHGEGVREADPEAAGTSAVGHRCMRGACDLVRVDLASGAVTVLAAGEPDGVTYAGARALPDGGIIVSVRRGDRWEIDLVDRDGRFVRRADPDDGAVRSGAQVAESGAAIVAASDRSGVMEIERIDLASGAARPLTRTTGAMTAPAPDPVGGGVFFLSLTPHGFDLRRAHPDSVDVAWVALGPELAPVAPVRPVAAPPFSPTAASPRSYGLGPRDHTFLPLGHWAPEGWAAGALVHGSDPVGRLGWNLGGMWGEESAWRGGSAAFTARVWRPEVSGAAFWARQRPSAQSLDDAAAPIGLDMELGGGALDVTLRRDDVSRELVARAGGSAARLDRPGLEGATRALGYAELSGAWRQTRGAWRFIEVVELHGATGRTAGEGWNRGIASARISAGTRTSALQARALYGVTDSGPEGFESFVFGGVPSPIVPAEILSQRLEEPAVPVGYAVGSRAASAKIEWVSGGVSTFYRWMKIRDSSWRRVTGIEARVDDPPLPFLGLPAIGLVVGFARSLDPPFEDENRFYLALRYGP